MYFWFGGYFSEMALQILQTHASYLCLTILIHRVLISVFFLNSFNFKLKWRFLLTSINNFDSKLNIPVLNSTKLYS
jgi:hypothetical protein